MDITKFDFKRWGILGFAIILGQVYGDYTDADLPWGWGFFGLLIVWVILNLLFDKWFRGEDD